MSTIVDATTPATSETPTRLIFRSLSGRTEIAVVSDGTVIVHVLNGRDTLTQPDLSRLLALLNATETATSEGACNVR